MSIEHPHNSFYHRLRNALHDAGYEPVTPIEGWQFNPSDKDPTQGELLIWLDRDKPPIAVYQTHVNPDEGNGPGLLP